MNMKNKLFLLLFLILPCFANSMDLYYDKSNQPESVSDEKMQSVMKNATDMWQKCGVKFNFEKSTSVVYWNSGSSLDIKGFTDIKEKDEKVIAYKIALNSLQSFQSVEYLSYILAHEIGHSIGLKHSLNKNSIMYFKTNDVIVTKLSPEDINECKQIISIL